MSVSCGDTRNYCMVTKRKCFSRNFIGSPLIGYHVIYPNLAIFEIQVASNFYYSVPLQINSAAFYSLWKTLGKSVTDSGCAYVT